jgi:type IV secretory pathway TraG/TraD family ATPase VirD4
MLHLGRATAWGIGLLQPVGIDIKRHFLFLAMNGSGKTTALITAVSEWKGSAFVIDPKAQIVNALADHDKKIWFVLDPSGISNAGKRININFLDCIKEAIERNGEAAAALWASRLSEALIRTPSGSKSPFFYDVPRQFVAGLILHIMSTYEERCHNLVFLRHLIVHGFVIVDDDGKQVTPEEAQQLLLLNMADNPAYGGVISGSAKAMMEAQSDTLGNLRATLLDQTKFIDSPNVQDVLINSDFSLADLKTHNDVVLAFTASIYSMQEELSSLSRLLTNMVAYTFESVQQKNGQCLAIVDELPSQGYNRTFETMLAVSRSMGLTLIAVSQNIELLKKHYPNSYKSFVGEADGVAWMGGNHEDNQKMLSYLLGVTTHPQKKRGHQTQKPSIKVMDEEQVKRYLDPDSDRMIVTFAGRKSEQLRNDPHYKALSVFKYAVDPEFGDRFPRNITRWIVSRIRSFKSKLKAISQK